MGNRLKKLKRYLNEEFSAANEASKSQIGFHGSGSITGGGYGSYGGSGSYLPKTCIHTGEKPEFILPLPGGAKITIAGARGSTIVEAKDTTLIIDLAGSVKIDAEPWIKFGPKHFKGLEPPPDVVKAPVLRLNWSDQGAPAVPVKWWARLLKLIEQHHAPGHIIVACAGSHGRTGTCIASMLLAGDAALSVEDAVNLVRDEHCEDSIESAAQLRYLMKFRPNEKLSDELHLEAFPTTKTFPSSTFPPAEPRHKNFDIRTDKPTKDGTPYLHIAACRVDTCPGCNLQTKPPFADSQKTLQ